MVDLDKKLEGLTKDEISQYLSEVEFYLTSIEDRIEVVEGRKTKCDKILIDLNLALKKDRHNLSKWKRYYEKVKRQFFRKDY
jgi:hypothetical protein